jgi:SiaC family regulatory phosphoprotein
MKPLNIDSTDDTPKVALDHQAGVLEFIGNSYPENSSKFYSPILDWLKDFQKHSQAKKVVASFNFDYFNTSSAKYILEILRLIEDYQKAGNECLIKWFYFEEDTDMLEAGEDYERTVAVPFELIEREDTF